MHARLPALPACLPACAVLWAGACAVHGQHLRESGALWRPLPGHLLFCCSRLACLPAQVPVLFTGSITCTPVSSAWLSALQLLKPCPYACLPACLPYAGACAVHWQHPQEPGAFRWLLRGYLLFSLSALACMHACVPAQVPVLFTGSICENMALNCSSAGQTVQTVPVCMPACLRRCRCCSRAAYGRT